MTDQTQLFDNIARTLNITSTQVKAFAELYDDGASVPFIARYRKDRTGGLDDTVLRELEKRLNYERDIAERRQKVKELLTNQNVALTDELIMRINNANSKVALDDIYQPYRPKRRSLATKASLANLDTVAKKILDGMPIDEALSDYTPVSSVTDSTGESLEVDYSTKQLQLAGVQAIILEEWSKQLDLMDSVRSAFAKTASIHAVLVSEDKRESGEKFKDYFDYTEPFAKITSHRLLAILRGRQHNVLAIHVQGEDEPMIQMIARHFNIDPASPNGQFLLDTANKLWTDKWRNTAEHRLLTEHRLNAEKEAISVFANNLKHLLMKAPVGQKVILGVDPGIRHGVKMAIIDNKGDVVTTATVYPFDSDQRKQEAKQVIKDLIINHLVNFVAIGNGTASRETERLIKSLISDNDLDAKAVMISEAGASVYSASELASDELPDLDVSVRGAVSIARRLQDPLSELVKVEPKAIGVGQYQHDVNQSELETSLDKVTEDCVNAVGVDVNTASSSILSHIAGLNKNVAEQIVKYRTEHGAFQNREALKAVPRLGEKTFTQSAGFLRIKSGDELLDSTGVHPESYSQVKALLNEHGLSLPSVIGNRQITNELLDKVDRFSPIGMAIGELGKARHDPRGEFKTAQFDENINDINDLKVGMILEGVVSNVTNFGCFVDVGVHQDGLVHISQLGDTFISDPHKVVKPLDIIKVRVLDVDKARNRIAFSMKLDDTPSDKSNDTPSDKIGASNFKKTQSDTTKPFKQKQDKPKALPKPQKSTTHQNKPDNKIGSFGALLKQAGLK